VLDNGGKGKSGKKAMPARRKFLVDMARLACGAGVFALATGMNGEQASALPPDAIRPPGTGAEEDFLAACTRCGMCVEACPYDILKLAAPGSGVATGTPYFNARTGPCEMCDDIPCIPACPTNALDHSLTDIDKARMGLAVVVDQESCIAFRGLRCEVCFNICPLQNKAIKLEYRPNKRTGMHAIFPPVVYSEYCTGCGLCEKACILEETAIRVLPIRLAKGELGHHYRLGWKRKGRDGKEFPVQDLEHVYRLPEGLKYEHAGRGLYETPDFKGRLPGDSGGQPAITVPGSDMQKTPFSSNPLDTLNRGIKGAK
jgi:ferredoxin-type protein NapG